MPSEWSDNHRSRAYSFTLNNWPDKLELKSKIDAFPCKYMQYAEEVGESGTPHLQGIVTYKQAISFGQAKKRFLGCHVEPARSVEHLMNYCTKGPITKRGTAPISKAQNDLDSETRAREIREAAEEGRIEDIPEVFRLHHPRLIEYHHDKALRERTLEDTTAQHLWFWGTAGTGKSRKAREDYPDLFDKSITKWWDGYNDEEVVLLDDFDKKHDWMIHLIKRWGDRYPFPAEMKNRSVKLRPKLIIITSNYRPQDIWPDASDHEPILRRFKLEKFSKHIMFDTSRKRDRSPSPPPS